MAVVVVVTVATHPEAGRYLGSNLQILCLCDDDSIGKSCRHGHQGRVASYEHITIC